MQVYNPLTIRQWFVWRPYLNGCIGAAIFFPLCWVLVRHFSGWVAIPISAIPAFAVFYFLETRAMYLKCPRCQKYIDPSTTPWMCGYKQCWNDNLVSYPFIRHCEHCDYVPKAYKCHHPGCGELIYFTEDRQKTCYAECVNVPDVIDAEMKRRNSRGDKFTQQVEKISDLKHDLNVTKLEKAIEIERNKPAVPPTSPEAKTREQMVIEAILNDVKLGKSIFETERRLKAEADKEFANDPDGLIEMYKIIEDIILKYKSPGY